MAHLYLAPYVGTGVVGQSKGKFVHDPWRPRGSEQPGWAAIDLRPGGVGLSGFALMSVPVRDDTIGDYLGGDVAETSLATKSTLESKLGVTLQEVVTKQMLAELLLVHGKDDGTRWKNLRVDRDGMYRLWLGGKIPLWEGKAISGGATITESFNTADSDTLGPDLTWTEFGGGDIDIVSNHAQGVYGSGGSDARADSDLATDDHYAQIKVQTAAVGGTQGGGAFCRKAGADTTQTYYLGWIAYGTGGILYVVSGGGFTQLGSTYSFTPLANTQYLTRVEADADQITLKIDGTTRVGPVTNGTISGNLRCGIRTYQSGGYTAVQLDDFEAGDLAAAGLSIPVAMAQYRQRWN